MLGLWLKRDYASLKLKSSMKLRRALSDDVVSEAILLGGEVRKEKD